MASPPGAIVKGSSLKKYGFSSFTLVLVFIPNASKEDVLALEQEIIDTLNPEYNICPPPRASPGVQPPLGGGQGGAVQPPLGGGQAPDLRLAVGLGPDPTGWTAPPSGDGRAKRASFKDTEIGRSPTSYLEL